jgi:hypothetical protein
MTRSRAAPPNDTSRHRRDIVGRQVVVPRWMPLGGEARIPRNQGVRRGRALAETVGAGTLPVEAIVRRCSPLVVDADRAHPPDGSRRAGHDRLWRGRHVLHRMPLLHQIGPDGCQTVCDRDLRSRAERATLAAGGPVIRSCSPLVIGTKRAPPPDLAARSVADLFGRQVDVSRRMPLRDELGPPAHPVPRSRRRARSVSHGAPRSTQHAGRAQSRTTKLPHTPRRDSSPRASECIRARLWIRPRTRCSHIHARSTSDA